MLPKKASRSVLLGETRWRWVETHGHQDFELRMELFDEPGQLLCVRFPYRHLDPAHPERVYRPIMVKRLLRDVVERALARGWAPRSKGVFELPRSEADTLVSDYDYRWSKWTVWTKSRYV